MNSHISAFGNSTGDIARAFGISPARFDASRLDLEHDVEGACDRIASHIGHLDSTHSRTNNTQRLDAKTCRDNASAFMTSALSEVIAPMEKVENRRYLFAPGQGSESLLPVREAVELGKQQIEWEVLDHSGESRWVSHGGTASLARVGSDSEYKSQAVGLVGIRFGWDSFELWQSRHLNGRSPQAERNRAARSFMRDHFEDVANWGDISRKIPGFWTTGTAITVDLAKRLDDPSLTFDEMMIQLSIMQLMWTRVNPGLNMSGLIMPETHRLRLLRLFKDNSGSDTNAWAFALQVFPWLRNVMTDDRLLTASPTGGPIWQAWSSSESDLFINASPAPNVFGPFEREMETEFILLQQQGGVVSKDYRRVMRFRMPAA